MKNSLVFILVLLGATLMRPAQANAQKGKGLVFDGKSQFVQFPATNFPTGKAARTLEFWVRAVPITDGKPHHIVNWGQMGAQGSTFGVYTRYLNGQNNLGFWSHNRDIESIAVLPDDQWHFVAVTYDGSNLRFFLDGESQALTAIALNTAPGPVFVGSRKDEPMYFQGAVRDIAVWNQARNQGQIQLDMIPWPALTGNESGLVAYVPLNEGTGNAFADKKNVIKGAIDNKATWSKPIPANPSPIDEGIWFVIQNKADLDNDVNMPARRMALSANGNSVAWAAIPLTGDYDAFLWRTVLQNGRYHLVNKKLGMTQALDCSQQGLTIGSYGTYGGQEWDLQLANLNDWGTNVYVLSNNNITSGKALALEANQVKVVARNAAQTNQAWVLQPMELAMGYHLPASAAANSPMTRELDLAYGFKVYATNTVQDWSVLNGHLIWKNMLNALYNTDAIARLNGTAFTRKELQIISRFDQNKVVALYPLNKANNQLIFDEKWMTDYRGGSGNDPLRNLSSTTVTEEMMCRAGVFSRGYNDVAIREFDQTVHEFAHALDHVCAMKGGENFPDPSLYGSKVEAIAAAIQAWFNNNNSYPDFARTRAIQKTQQPAHYDRLKQFFRESNSWMPPRWLRNQPDGRVELKDGNTLQVGQWIYSTSPHGSNGTYAVLQPDGNFAVYSNNDNVFKWGSFNNLDVALNKVKTLKMESGILRMKDANGNNIYSSKNSAAPGARLVIGEPLPGKPNSWIRIVNGNGTLLWTPD